MKNDPEHIVIQFLDTAKPILYSAVNEFQSAVKRLNRNLEEYRFNQLRDQHVVSLKLKLERAAKDSLAAHQHNSQLDGLDRRMQQIIKEYLHEFVVRSRSI